MAKNQKRILLLEGIHEAAVESLQELGFTETEALAYAGLVPISPATGYRVAQAIGKPAANTYKALESLEAKGAVLVESGAVRPLAAIS